MELIDRINAILPTIAPNEPIHPDFQPLVVELGFPDEWRGTYLTSEKAKKFLKLKRDEINGRN